MSVKTNAAIESSRCVYRGKRLRPDIRGSFMRRTVVALHRLCMHVKHDT